MPMEGFLFILCFPLCLEEQAFDHIFKTFKNYEIRYVCIASEMTGFETLARLNIQIIFFQKKSIYTPFMDKFLGSFDHLELFERMRF